jgi:ATP/maltotriose-dependent transcriptional regulator MalT
MGGPVSGSAFVGRTDELRTLAECRLAAARGRGCCVVLSGEAGIGKSRLVAAFREGLDRRQAAFGFARANEFGSAPYESLLSALRELGRNPVIPATASAPEQLAALSAEVASACEKRGCVLVLEDAQWADEGTWRFLLHVLPFVSSMRLLIIVTYRSETSEAERSGESYVARLYRNPAAHRVELARLSVAELREMLASATRTPLSSEALDEIIERSDGNPFFAEELLKSALDTSRDERRTRELPLTIRAAVLERCATLDDATQEILRGAAIVGRRFDADFLTEVLGKSRSEVLDGIDRLRGAHVIEETGDQEPRYAFRHALTRDAVYSTMLADVVQPLHDRIFRVLERRGGRNYDLGFHAWAAGNAAAAIRYNERAGDEAVALYAYADARVCYERALSFAAVPLDRARLLEKNATAAGRDGKADIAETLFGRAATAYEQANEPEKLVDAAVAMSSQARHAGSMLRSRIILQRVLDRLPQNADVARGRLAVALAFTQTDCGALHEADRLIAESSAVADTPAYANTVAYISAVRGDLPGLRASLRRYVERCESLAPEMMPQARFNAGFQLCILGLDDEALATFELLLPELREKHLTSLEVLTCANAALIESRAGRWPRARALVERALAIPEPATTGPAALAAAGITIALAQRDERLASRLHLRTAADHAFASGINSTLGRLAGPYARWLHERGNTDEAQLLLRKALSRLTVPFGATETLVAAMELGDHATKRDVSTFLSAMDAMGELPLYAATSAHVWAIAAHDAGDLDAARLHADAAASQYRILGWPEHERRVEALGTFPRTGAEPVPPVLSMREREIAELVAQGLANKHLATRLSVSQRTIEKHLTSIFDKLGVRNRSELTAFVVRQSEQQRP